MQIRHTLLIASLLAGVTLLSGCDDNKVTVTPESDDTTVVVPQSKPPVVVVPQSDTDVIVVPPADDKPAE